MSEKLTLHRVRLVDFINALEKACTSYLQSRIASKLSQGRYTTRDELIEAVYGGAKEPACPERNIDVGIWALRKKGYQVETRTHAFLHVRQP